MPLYKEYLLSKAQDDLSNGGRGIGNMVETYLVNPLAELLIKEKWAPGDSIVIEDKSNVDDQQLTFTISKIKPE